MPDSSPDKTPNDRASGPHPLSRRASRRFVIGAILFIIAATIGGSLYLVNVASQALEVPVDTTVTDTTAVDTTGRQAPPDALR